jgi:hypothetical protein
MRPEIPLTCQPYVNPAGDPAVGGTWPHAGSLPGSVRQRFLSCSGAFQLARVVLCSLPREAEAICCLFPGWGRYRIRLRSTDKESVMESVQPHEPWNKGKLAAL